MSFSCSDHVFEPFPQGIVETVWVHSNSNRGDDSSLSDAIIPFPQTPQFCFSRSQLGLHIPCGWCLYPCGSYIAESQFSCVGTIFGLETTSTSAAAGIFGNGILPEIQVHFKFLNIEFELSFFDRCFFVFRFNEIVSASGYWAFGNKSSSNILKSLMPDDGPSLAPTMVIGLALYSQVAYELMEQQSADVNQGMFSKRNLIPRLILRTLYVICSGFIAAMLPFFGYINGVIGSIGFIPPDFVLLMLLYNMTYKRSKSSSTYWFNLFIMVVFTGVKIMGAFSWIRKLVLDATNFKLFSSYVVD
ncbi:putative GABA transporter 2 [Hibiscus syriacus]|uniref:GABA transporter 2 n=1 Tax=Hibiscus syriacus TaxID=106335 RepID=A0A6A2Y5Y6_HIBSY|nr:putative GABA transporter 2 [Hibiscus syriacus]